MKRQANQRELRTLLNYLAGTTGAVRSDLLKAKEYQIRRLIDNGFLNKGYITRITNIIKNTDALETLSNQCLWY